VPSSLASASYPYFRTRIDPRRDFDLQAFHPLIAPHDLHLRGGTAHRLFKTDFNSLLKVLPCHRGLLRALTPSTPPQLFKE
jgi:hypothetical protein